MLKVDLGNLIIFVTSILIFTGSVWDAVRMRLRLRQVNAKLQQAQIDSVIYLMEISKMMSERDAKTVEQTDGFLKFVSDSRDWAFDYIDKAQKTILEYDEALSSADAKAINEKYKALIDLLPKDDVIK